VSKHGSVNAITDGVNVRDYGLESNKKGVQSFPRLLRHPFKKTLFAQTQPGLSVIKQFAKWDFVIRKVNFQKNAENESKLKNPMHAFLT